MTSWIPAVVVGAPCGRKSANDRYRATKVARTAFKGCAETKGPRLRPTLSVLTTAGDRFSKIFVVYSVGYWEAWSVWFSGQKLDGYSMWLVPMVWWARFGKLLQFASGVAVILDLVGPERLRQFGARMPKAKRASVSVMQISRKRGKESLFDFLQWVMERPGWLPVLWSVLSVSLTWQLTVLAVNEPPYIRDAALWGKLLVGLISFLVIHFLVILLLKFGLFPLGYFINKTASFLEWTLRDENPGHQMRWVAFVMFLFGFHLDLLGS